MKWPNRQRILLQLLYLQCVGKVRRAVRRLWSPKRAALALLAVALVGCWVFQEVSWWYVTAQTPQVAPAQVVRDAPLVMLGILLLKLSPLVVRRDLAGVRLRGGDAQFLLAGPFQTADVRFYKMAGHLLSVFVTAFFASLFTCRYASSWLHAYLACFLAMMWIYLMYLFCALAVSYASPRVYSALRWTAVATCLGLTAICWNTGLRASGAGLVDRSTLQASLAVVEQWSDSVVGSVGLGVFHFIARLLPAKSYAELILGSSVALGGALVFWYGVLTWETYLVTRASRQEVRYFARYGTAPPGMGWDGTRQTHHGRRSLVAKWPWWGGAGPIVWRQLCAVRHHALAFTGITAATLGGTVWVLTMTDHPPSQGDFAAWLLLVFITALVLPGMLPYDFRSDYPRIPLLKTLPIRPSHIALGQLLVPVGLTTLLQFLLLCVWWCVNPREGWSLAFGPLFLFPLNVLFYAMENLVFLLYPYHPGEMSFHATVGRILKGVARMVLFVLAALAAVMFSYVTLYCIKIAALDPSHSLMVRVILFLWWVVGGWLLIAGAASAMVAALCVVYTRYDPGTDSPLRSG